jgi:hypothetical protein
MEKVIIAATAVWFVFGLMATGMLIRARHKVEFKVSSLAVIPTLALGPFSFFGFLGMDDKAIAQHLDDHATELIRLRELNAELIKQKDSSR